MIKIVIEYLPYLAIVVLTNIGTGIYNSINVKKIDFDMWKFINGIAKMCIIVGSFIGTAFVYDKIGSINLGGIELTPNLILISAIVMYFGKTMTNLKEILKVENIVEDNTILSEENEIK